VRRAQDVADRDIIIGKTALVTSKDDHDQVGWYNRTNTDAVAGTRAQVLTQPAVAGAAGDEARREHQASPQRARCSGSGDVVDGR
jgi:hypothetical protein